jgi:UDP-3-O-[3-hydroxymyristoyl] glucosamine N-acyltransferase
MKVKDIAAIIDGEIDGNEQLEISGVEGLEEGQEGDICFLADEKLIDLAEKSQASCIITRKSFSFKDKTVIYTENPALSFIKVIECFHPQEKKKPSISKSAIIDNNVSIGENAYIGPYVIIESGVTIGEQVNISPFTYIGRRVSIGNHVDIKTSVRILDDTIIGDRVIIHPGAVIGSDGYSYVTVKDKHHKIPQVGNVMIEDDCEIGANVTIDRATFGETRIGKGTKIDNLVQIGHNVTIDENSLIIAQVGIAGSCHIGKNVTLAGQVGVADHLNIGDGAIVAAQGGVTKDIPPNAVYSGYPARDHLRARKIYAASVRLPELLKRVRKIERSLDKIEERLKKI